MEKSEELSLITKNLRTVLDDMNLSSSHTKDSLTVLSEQVMNAQVVAKRLEERVRTAKAETNTALVNLNKEISS